MTEKNFLSNSPSPLKEKSFAFAIRIVKLSQYLSEHKKDYIISKQILRAGTAIGALVREAQQAENRSDFIHKLAIALKEANETDYWLDLLKETNYINKKQHESIKTDIVELLKLLTSIIKTTKAKQ